MSFTRCGLTALGAAAILSACSGQPVDDSKLTMIDGRRTFELLHEEGQRVVPVDAQSRSKYEYAHIPNAVYLPPPFEKGDPRIPDHDVLIVYGTDWNDPRAVAASKSLLHLGYKDVLTYQGGILDWIRLQYPVAGEAAE